MDKEFCASELAKSAFRKRVFAGFRARKSGLTGRIHPLIPIGTVPQKRGTANRPNGGKGGIIRRFAPHPYGAAATAWRRSPLPAAAPSNHYFDIEGSNPASEPQIRKAPYRGLSYLAEREGLPGTSLCPALRARCARSKSLPAILSNPTN